MRKHARVKNKYVNKKNYIRLAGCIQNFKQNSILIHYGCVRIDFLQIWIIFADETTRYKSYNHCCEWNKKHAFLAMTKEMLFIESEWK